MIKITASLRYDQTLYFDNLVLNLEEKTWTCLLGQSGIGKSSLLKMLAGLIPNDVSEKQSCMAHIESDSHTAVMDKIAYMGQTDLLLPWFNVLDNVLLGYRLRQEKDEALKILALELLEKVGLEGKENFKPHQLSGGMRQRVALVRTLIENKPIVLLDEPFQALDAITRLKVQNLFVECLKDKTVLLVTHDPIEALRLGHQVFVMSQTPAVLQTVKLPDSAIPRKLTDPSFLESEQKILEFLDLQGEL